MKLSVKKFLTKLLLGTLLVLLSGKFTACEPEDWVLDVNCADCYDYRPDSANLIIYVSIDLLENDSVPLTFYRGDYEDGEIDWQDTATTNEFYLYSEMNRSYTVRAQYRSGETVIEAFDADHMELYDADEECGYPCYIIKGGILDLRRAD